MGCLSRRPYDPRARIGRRDAGGRERTQPRLQRIYLRRQGRKLTGYSLQIGLLSCRTLRERRQRRRILSLRELDIRQRGVDGGIRYRGRSNPRWGRRGDPIGFRLRGAIEVRPGEGIEFWQSDMVEIRRRKAVEARQRETGQGKTGQRETWQGVGGGRAEDRQGGQRHHGCSHAARGPQRYRLGLLVALHLLVRCFSHLRSLHLSPVATVPQSAKQKEPSRGRSSDDPRTIAQPNTLKPWAYMVNVRLFSAGPAQKPDINPATNRGG